MRAEGHPTSTQGPRSGVTVRPRPDRADRPSWPAGRPRPARWRAELLRPVPFARPARPPLDRVTSRLEPRTSRACSPTPPWWGSWKSAWPNVSVCRTGRGQLLHVRPDTGAPGAAGGPSGTSRGAELHVLCDRAGRDVEQPHVAVRRPATRPASRSTSRAAIAALDGASALIATHVFGAPCDPAASKHSAARARPCSVRRRARVRCAVRGCGHRRVRRRGGLQSHPHQGARRRRRWHRHDPGRSTGRSVPRGPQLRESG